MTDPLQEIFAAGPTAPPPSVMNRGSGSGDPLEDIFSRGPEPVDAAPVGPGEGPIKLPHLTGGLADVPAVFSSVAEQVARRIPGVSGVQGAIEEARGTIEQGAEKLAEKFPGAPPQATAAVAMAPHLIPTPSEIVDPFNIAFAATLGAAGAGMKAVLGLVAKKFPVLNQPISVAMGMRPSQAAQALSAAAETANIEKQTLGQALDEALASQRTGGDISLPPDVAAGEARRLAIEEAGSAGAEAVRPQIEYKPAVPGPAAAAADIKPLAEGAPLPAARRFGEPVPAEQSFTAQPQPSSPAQVRAAVTEVPSREPVLPAPRGVRGFQQRVAREEAGQRRVEKGGERYPAPAERPAAALPVETSAETIKAATAEPAPVAASAPVAPKEVMPRTTKDALAGVLGKERERTVSRAASAPAGSAESVAGHAIAEAAPDLGRLKGSKADIGPDLAGALDDVAEMSERGYDDIGKVIRQEAMFGGEVRSQARDMLAEWLATEKDPKVIADTLRDYAKRMSGAKGDMTVDLFNGGNSKPAIVANTIEGKRGGIARRQEDLLPSPRPESLGSAANEAFNPDWRTPEGWPNERTLKTPTFVENFLMEGAAREGRPQQRSFQEIARARPKVTQEMLTGRAHPMLLDLTNELNTAPEKFRDAGALGHAGPIRIVTDSDMAKHIGIKNVILWEAAKERDMVSTALKFGDSWNAVLKEAKLKRGTPQAEAFVDLIEGKAPAGPVTDAMKAAVPKAQAWFKEFWKYMGETGEGVANYFPHMRDLMERELRFSFSDAKSIAKAVDEGRLPPFFLKHREDLMRDFLKDPFGVVEAYIQMGVREREMRSVMQTQKELAEWFEKMANAPDAPGGKAAQRKYGSAAKFLGYHIQQTMGTPDWLEQFIGRSVVDAAQGVMSATAKTPRWVQNLVPKFVKDAPNMSEGAVGKVASGTYRGLLAMRHYGARVGSVVANFLGNLPNVVGAIGPHRLMRGMKDAVESLSKDSPLHKVWEDSGLWVDGRPSAQLDLDRPVFNKGVENVAFGGLQAGDALPRKALFFELYRENIKKYTRERAISDAVERTTDIMPSVLTAVRAAGTKTAAGKFIAQGSTSAIHTANGWGLGNLQIALMGGDRMAALRDIYGGGVSNPKLRALATFAATYAILEMSMERNPLGTGLANWAFAVPGRAYEFLRSASGGPKEAAKAAVRLVGQALPVPFLGAVNDVRKYMQGKAKQSRFRQIREAQGF